ncbi:hypothetical protein L1887_32803 [Cichorium endivia]|nr:hypothetical protein L1887_32803 [Cichorium endivia]
MLLPLQSVTHAYSVVTLQLRSNFPQQGQRKDQTPQLKKFFKLDHRPREERKTLFYFNGNLGPAYEHGRPEATQRKNLDPPQIKKGSLGNNTREDVIVIAHPSESYHEDLVSSVFCGVMSGDAWSGRMEDSILQGCIAVVIQDKIFLPWENVLNYESFAVRLGEDEIPNLIN